jgi:hypothetical protein
MYVYILEPILSDQRTENTMAKRTMFYKTLHRKLTKDWATRTPVKTGSELRCSFFIWPNKLHLLFYRYILLSQILFFIFLACHCLILYIKLPFHSQESNCLLFFLDRYYSITKQKLIYSKMHDDIVIHDQLTGWRLPVTDTQWFYMRTLTSSCSTCGNGCVTQW